MLLRSTVIPGSGTSRVSPYSHALDIKFHMRPPHARRRPVRAAALLRALSCAPPLLPQPCPCALPTRARPTQPSSRFCPSRRRCPVHATAPSSAPGPPLRAPPRPLRAASDLPLRAAAPAAAAPCAPQQGPVRAATPPSALPLLSSDPCAPCPAQFASQPLPPPLPRARRRPGRPAPCAPPPPPGSRLSHRRRPVRAGTARSRAQGGGSQFII